MFFFLLTVSKYQSAETGFNFDLILYLGLSGFKDQIDRVTFTKLITLTNRCQINLLTINAKGQACNCNFTQKEEITKFQWFCIVFYFLSGKTEIKTKRGNQLIQGKVACLQGYFWQTCQHNWTFHCVAGKVNSACTHCVPLYFLFDTEGQRVLEFMLRTLPYFGW